MQSAVEIVNRELHAFSMILNVKKKLDTFKKRNDTTADVFMRHVLKHPNKPCIIFNEQIWTFQDVCLFTFFFQFQM